MTIARSYGKKPLGKKMDDRLDGRTETRDAEIYDIQGNGLCRVQVQGSTQKISARYPEGWESNPNFLKEGQSVRIQHRGGLRGLVEIVCLGQTVPTGGDAPVIGGGADTVLVDGGLRAELNTPTRDVYYGDVEYRIEDLEYTITGGSVTIDAAPSMAGYYRYDIIVVGIDGVVHVVKGEASTSAVVPAVPAYHLTIGSPILVVYGTSVVSQDTIGQEYTDPEPAYITMSIDDETLSWSETSTHVRLTVYDQYGRALAGTGTGWYLTLEITTGNGQISSAEDGTDTVKVGQHTGSASYYDFTYIRDKLATDESPSLTGTLEEGTYLETTGDIVLLDASGVPMVVASSYAFETYLGADEYEVVSAENLDIDWSTGETQVLSLGAHASVYVRSFANMERGVYRLVVCQDAGGGHTLGWNSALSIWWQDVAAPTLTTTGVRLDVVTFLVLEDGTRIGGTSLNHGKP